MRRALLYHLENNESKPQSSVDKGRFVLNKWTLQFETELHDWVYGVGEFLTIQPCKSIKILEIHISFFFSLNMHTWKTSPCVSRTCGYELLYSKIASLQIFPNTVRNTIWLLLVTIISITYHQYTITSTAPSRPY